MVWDAIAEFVGAVLRQFYRSDADVTADSELQAWVRELADPEIGNFRGLADAGGGLASLDRLVQVATTIVFIATAEHSAPTTASTTVRLHPERAGRAVRAAARAPRPRSPSRAWSRPCRRRPSLAEQIAMVHLLSEPTEPPLGRYAPEFFAGNPEIAPIVERFDAALQAVAAQIDARNARLAVPYTYLHPAFLYSSIEI